MSVEENQTVKITCLPDARTFSASKQTNLLHASLDAGVPFTHACGGNARCSTCRVMVLKGAGNLSPRTEAECEMADRLKFDPKIRLACQTSLLGNVQIKRLVLDEEDYLLTKREEGSVELASVGTEESVAILFADIRSFTPFAESLPPYDIIHILDRYFHRMGKVIEENGGYINNYMGDGLLALFESKPDQSDSACLRSVKAGLQMLSEVKRLEPYLVSFSGSSFKIGIGIHYGEAVLGTVGYGKDRRRTAIGDSVNFASRIESANKKAKTELLISSDLYKKIERRILTGKSLKLKIRGKTGHYRLHEVLGLKNVD